MELESFTPAQVEALKQAYTLLGEHFDHALICVDTEVEEMTPDGESQSQFYFCLKGGQSAACGMAHRFMQRITHSDARSGSE